MRLSAFTQGLSIMIGKPFDFPTQELIKEFALANRQTLVRQDYQKTGNFPTSSTVSFCVNVTEKNSTECCGVDLGCKVEVSVEDIPLPMDVKDQVNFLYVGGITGMEPFGYLKPVELPFVKNRRLTSELKYYTYINRKLVFINTPGLEKAKIIYVPASLTDAAKMIDCSTGKSCIDVEDDSFIEGHWVDALTKMVLPLVTRVNEEQINVDENGQG